MIEIHSCYLKDLDSKWAIECAAIPKNLLLFITKGSVIYWVDKQVHRLKAGEVLYISAGSMRSGFATEYNQRYAVEFSMLGNEGEYLPNISEKHVHKAIIQNMEYFKQRFAVLQHHWSKKASCSKVICSAVLLEMLGIIHHDMNSGKFESRKTKMILKIKHYIRNHYHENIKLRDLSDLCGRTPNYISFVFKEATGFTPIEFLQEVRISAAKDLMLSKQLSFAEISERTGFCDQAYFYRVFKKLTGCSPSRFVHEKLS